MDGFPPPVPARHPLGPLLLVLILGIAVGAGGYAFISRYRVITPPSTASTQSSVTTPTSISLTEQSPATIPSAPSSTVPSTATTPTSNQFDATKAKVGDRFGAMTLDSMSIFSKDLPASKNAPISNTNVRAVFSGTVQVSGTWSWDANVGYCLTFDEASTKKVPISALAAATDRARPCIGSFSTDSTLSYKPVGSETQSPTVYPVTLEIDQYTLASFPADATDSVQVSKIISQTFTSQTHQFSVMYPGGWSVTLHENTSNVFDFYPTGKRPEIESTKTGDIILTVRNNPKQLNLKAFYSSGAVGAANLFEDASQGTETLVIDGRSATKFKSVGGLVNSTIVSVAYGTRILEVADLGEKHQQDGIFDALVASLKFQ